MTVLSQSQTCSKDVETDLLYAGEITGRARLDVVDPSRTNLAFTPSRVVIQDARPIREELTVDDAGFAFVKHRSRAVQEPSLVEANMAHNKDVGGASDLYKNEIIEYLKAATGADTIFPQLGGLVVRTSTRAPRKAWAAPANLVHLDYTPKSAEQFLGWSAAAHGLALKPYKRFAIYQTWRAVSPAPQDSVLAVCDGRSVRSGDAIVFDSVLGPEDEPACFFEARICRPDASHRWYYLSDMEDDDLLIFKGFDSDVPNAMNAMHTAFDNPLAGPDAPPRVSIEARFVALFD